MGITIEAWRARIGRYARAGSSARKRASRSNECLLDFLMVTLAVGVIGMILVIGGVEVNPGPYPCNLCSVVPETISSSIRHQQDHAAQIDDFTYRCPAEDCSYYTDSYAALLFHVSCKHRGKSHVDPAVTARTECPYSTDTEVCTYSTTSLRDFVQHLFVHLKKGTPVECPIENCNAATKTFARQNLLSTHLSQHHRNWRAEGVLKKSADTFRVNPTDIVNPPDPTGQNTMTLSVEEATDDPLNVDRNEVLDSQAIMDGIGKFYLHLYAQNLLPQTYIQEICDSLMFLTEVVHARIKMLLSSELRKLGIEETKVNKICFEVQKTDLLYTTHHKYAPGPSFTSHHLRKKYFKDRFNYQAPEQVPLDEHDPTQSFQYVSIRETLETLLADPSVQKEIDESFIRRQQEKTNEVSDYTDGTLFQSENHPAKEIDIFLNQDTFNGVLNALGSAKNKYKSLCMYFTIGNWKPHIRSRIVTKFLVMIIREAIFKAVGAKKCLEKVITELKDLQTNGIMYKGENIKVCLQFMLGDNLGQHLIAGFIESFSTKFMCRFCDMKSSEFKANPSKTKRRRSVRDYNRCVMKARLLGKHSKGIKAGCEFNCLKYFHATTHLPCCVAHDLFEGVVCWDLKGIIEHFVKMKWFSIELLNRRIKAFKCQGTDGPNKPAFVQKDGSKLGGHAIQNWTLLRLLYFIIGDKIQNFEDPGWLLYLQLKELCEHFCSPSFHKTDIPYIRDVLLPSYFARRAEVLTDEKYSLKPKHHYFSHCCQFLLEYGPLLYLWTLPFEQKHKIFKQLLRNTRNFNNPEFSCAERQQMYFCYTTLTPLFEEDFASDGAKPLSPESFIGNVASFVRQLNFNGQWNHADSLDANHITYKVEDIVLINQIDNSRALSVGVIKVIAFQGEDFHLIIEERKAIYHQDKGIHEVNFDTEATVTMISPSDLKYPVPHPLYAGKNGEAFFSLKFALIGEQNPEEDL